MHVLITRPEPDASAWHDHLASLGISSTLDPMLDISLAAPSPVLVRERSSIDRSNDGKASSDDGPSSIAAVPSPQALVITSRNAVRWLETATDLANLATLPVYTVGPGSTAALRALGFSHIIEGAATARDLAPVITATADPAAGPLLHLSGDKLAFDLAPPLLAYGLTLNRRIVYRSRPAVMLRAKTLERLRDGTIDTVVLLSPLTAETFVRLLTEAQLNQAHQQLVYICLSDMIARIVVKSAPRGIIVAAAPNAKAVLNILETRATSHRAC